jgi:hypothetical protein
VGSVAERLALAEHIQGLWYPKWSSAWLKAVPAAPMITPAVRAELGAAGDEAAVVAARRQVVQEFLDSHLYNWLPEDSAYGTLTECEWRPLDRAELLRCVDEILAGATERLAEVRAEEAAERAQAEEGGYLHAIGRSRLEGDMIDLDALRRWFTEALWSAAGPTWFTNMGPGFDEEPAVIGVDGDVLALLWLP